MQLFIFAIVILCVSSQYSCQLIKLLGDGFRDAVKKVHDGIHNGFDINIHAEVKPLVPNYHQNQQQEPPQYPNQQHEAPQYPPYFQGNQNFNRPNFPFFPRPNYQHFAQPPKQDNTIIVIVEQQSGNQGSEGPVQQQPQQNPSPQLDFNNIKPNQNQYGTIYIENGDMNKKDEPTLVDFNVNQYDFNKEKTSTSSPKRETSDQTPDKDSEKCDDEEDFKLDVRYGDH